MGEHYRHPQIGRIACVLKGVDVAKGVPFPPEFRRGNPTPKTNSR
jgi:hypothetical protein